MYEALNKKVCSVLNVIVIFLLSALSCTVFFQVLNRMFFHLVMPWTEEISRYLFVWMLLTGAARSTYLRIHVVVDVIPTLWPGRKSDITTYVANVITTIFYVLLIYFGFKWAFKSAGTAPTSVRIDFFYINIVLPISFCLMLLFHIQHLVADFKKLFLNKNQTTEKGGA